MAYTFWQEMPQIKVLTAEYFPVRRLPAGTWDGWRAPRTWVLDFADSTELECGVRTKGRERTIARKTKTWHLYAPGVEYREKYSDGAILEDMWLLFEFARPFPAFKGITFSALHDPEERLCPYVREIFALQNSHSAGSRITQQGLALALIGDIVSSMRHGGGSGDTYEVTGTGRDHRNADSLLQQVDDIVLSKISAAWPLDDLAARMNMSVSSLVHRFKAENGMTIIERQRWLKIREARRLLNERGATVKAVALKLGFCSPFYFSKVFSEVAGLPPLAYMKQSRHGT